MHRRTLLGSTLAVALAGCAGPAARPSAPGARPSAGPSVAPSADRSGVTPGAGPTSAVAPSGKFGDLAAQLVRVVGPRHPNLVFSPFSIGTVLAMVSGGAAGDTAAELDRLLGEGAGELAASVNTVWRAVTADAGLGLTGANQVWAEEALRWKQPYLDHLADFGAPLRRLAIGADPERTRLEVNAWVEHETHDLITELLKPGLVTSRTRMVLVNALHAQGAWARPFFPQEAFGFTTADGRQVSVPGLAGGGRWHWAETDAWAGTAVPIDRAETVLVLLQPRDPELLPRVGEPDAAPRDHVVTDLAILDVLASEPAAVEVQLPRWKVSSDLDLREAMARVGVHDLFDPLAADLSAMTDDERLYVSFLVHRAVMAVDEEGFEAAAATAAGIEAAGAPMVQHVLTLDRPFGFALVHAPTRTILFAGHVGDPAA